MSFRVKSYFRINDSFVEVHNFDGRFRNQAYIDGAIELQVDGQEILSLAHWDLVDQLWGYILDGVEELEATGLADFGFPDRAEKLCFRSMGTQNVEVLVHRTRRVVRKTELFHAIGQGGVEFFERMDDLAPGNWKTYQDMARALLRRHGVH